MPLVLPFDPTGLPPATAEYLDDVLARIQTWAGAIEGFGKWITVPYDASNYGSNLGKWTVDQGDYVSYRYTIIGSTMILEVTATTTSTDSAIDSGLTVKVPGNYRVDISNAVDIANANWVAGYLHWGRTSGGVVSGAGIVKPAWDGGYSASLDRRNIVGLFRDFNETSWTASISDDLFIGMVAIFPVTRIIS